MPSSTNGWNLIFTTAYSFNPTNAFAPLPRAALGVFSLPTVTQDGAFYFTTNTSLPNGITLKLGNLNRSNRYDLQLYGARDATTFRTTLYTVTGTSAQTNQLQTSGTGMDTNSSGAACNYNASKVASFLDVTPDTNGQITINFRSTNDLGTSYLTTNPAISLNGTTNYWNNIIATTNTNFVFADNTTNVS